MRAAFYGGSPSLQIDDRPVAVIDKPADEVIRIVLPCVCSIDR